jgi:DNA polymerase III delta subunit
MRYLVFGEDSYRSSQRLAELRQAFRDARDPGGYNTVEVTGELGVKAFAAEVMTAPFLAERKMVVARGYLRLPKQEQQEVIQVLESMPDSVVAMFYEVGSSKDFNKSPLFSLLAADKSSQEFKVLSPHEVGLAMVGELRRLGLSVDSSVTAELGRLLPADSWIIVNEAEKLAAWVKSQGKYTFGLDDLRGVLSDNLEGSVFSFLDACLDGNPRKASIDLNRLLAEGMNEHQVLSAVTKQVRTLLAVSDEMTNGENNRDKIANKLGQHPFPVGKAMKAAVKCDNRTLRRLLAACLSVEQRLKSSATGIEAVELLSVRLSVAMRG